MTRFVTKLSPGSPFAIFAATAGRDAAEGTAAERLAKQARKEEKRRAERVAKREADRKMSVAIAQAMAAKAAELEREEAGHRDLAAEIREATAVSDAIVDARQACDAVALFKAAYAKASGTAEVPKPKDKTARAIVEADQRRRGLLGSDKPHGLALAILKARAKADGEDEPAPDDEDEDDGDEVDSLVRDILNADRKRRGQA